MRTIWKYEINLATSFLVTDKLVRFVQRDTDPHGYRECGKRDLEQAPVIDDGEPKEEQRLSSSAERRGVRMGTSGRRRWGLLVARWR